MLIRKDIPITSPEDAKQTWATFNKAHEIKGHPTKISDISRFQSQEDLSKIIKLQQFWRRKTELDTLVTVNPKGNHTDEFHHFIQKAVQGESKENKTIKKSINENKRLALFHAINRGNWDDPVFNDQTLSELTLSLYASNKITRSQAVTILERVQTFRESPHVRTCLILANDHFTEEAKEALPFLNDENYHRYLNAEQREEFRLLVLTLPKSEQYFYLTKKGVRLSFFSLGSFLVNQTAIMLHKEHIAHLSNGALDALGIAQFGLSEYARPLRRLGMFTKLDIEAGVKEHMRYSALHYPNTVPYHNIHGHTEITAFEGTAHDIYHSLIMSAIPNPFLDAFTYIAHIARENSKLQWSLEIWDWRDVDFKYFFENKLNYRKIIQNFEKQTVPEEKDTSTQRFNIHMTQLFCRMLIAGNNTSLMSEQGYLTRNSFVTPLGIFIFMDFVKNPDIWQSFYICPEHLVHPYYEKYQIAKILYPIIKNDPPKIQALKFFIYEKLFNTKQEATFEDINRLINSIKNLEARLAFNKLSPSKDSPYSRRSNLTYFTIDSVPVNNVTIAHLIHYFEKTTSTHPYSFHGMEKNKNLVEIMIAKELALNALIKIIGLNETSDAKQIADTIAQHEHKELSKYIRLTAAGIDLDYLKTLSKDESDLIDQNEYGLTRLIREGNIPFAALQALDEDSRKLIYKDYHWVLSLTNKYISYSALFALAPPLRKLLFELSYTVVLLADAGLPPQELIDLEPSLRAEVLEKDYRFIHLSKIAKFPLKKILSFDHDMRSVLTDNTHSIERLLEAGISFTKLVSLDLAFINKLLNNSYKFETLAKKGISASAFIEMNAAIQDRLLNNYYHLTTADLACLETSVVSGGLTEDFNSCKNLQLLSR